MQTVRHLGKRPPRFDNRTLRLSKYLAAAPQLPSAPPLTGYIEGITGWGALLNDRIGDCTVACAGHEILQWSTFAGSPQRITESDALTAYEAVSGYRPSDPTTDVGAFILDVLNYWRHVGIGGHKIVAYMAVNWLNHQEVKQAINLFGNVYLGLGLPLAAQNPSFTAEGLPKWNIPTGRPLTGPFSPWSWGGHAIPIIEAGKSHHWSHGTRVVTWGDVYCMTWGFMDAYGDEAYTIVSEDWINANSGLAPSGFDLEQLLSDLSEIR